MTVLQRSLGSKDFHLTSIILASSGITMHLWTCLPHSAGKKALRDNALVLFVVNKILYFMRTPLFCIL